MAHRVLVSGTFDLLHYGHRRLLRKARKIGGDGCWLMASCNSDEWCESTGKHPSQTSRERVAALDASGLVDLAVSHTAPEGEARLIGLFGIDTYVYGSDLEGTPAKLRLHELCPDLRMVCVRRTPLISSTLLRRFNRLIGRLWLI